MQSNADLLNSIDNFDFCIFNVNKHLGREYTMPLLVWKILDKLDLIDMIEEEHLANFLDQIYLKYSRDVQYHNDLHGADVAQMGYRMLTKGYLT